MPMSLVLESPAVDTALQMDLTKAEQMGRITSLTLLSMLCLLHPRMLLTFFVKGTLLAHGQLGVHQDPQGSFLQNSFLSCFPVEISHSIRSSEIQDRFKALI